MEEGRKRKIKLLINVMILIEFSIVFVFLLIFFNLSSAQVGRNVTVITNMSIGNSAPEIINITIYQDVAGGGINLIPNSTKEIVVESIIRDYNGESDILNATMEFYNSFGSSYGSSDDNNTHYTNISCNRDNSYGDSTETNFTCIFNIWYYADNSTWNLSAYTYDSFSLSDYKIKQTKINTLLAIGLPDEINYGGVNATNVSAEQVVNITNFGNVRINLTLEGYARNRSDGLAMNCTLGLTRNISIGYEKYNLTASNTSVLSLTQFQTIYANLTNTSVIKSFGLNYRQNEDFNEAVNATYWRIYVPAGVAGSCSGNIILGATRSSGS